MLKLRERNTAKQREKYLTRALPSLSVAGVWCWGRFWRLAGRRPALLPTAHLSWDAMPPAAAQPHFGYAPECPVFNFFAFPWLGRVCFADSRLFAWNFFILMSKFYIRRLDWTTEQWTNGLFVVCLLIQPLFHESRYVWQIRQVIVMFAALLHHSYYLVKYNTALKTIYL